MGVIFINKLFNPQSFLTAVMQTTARKNEWPLDKMTINTDVTKKTQPDDIDSAAREGAYVHGLFLEGARWDAAKGELTDPVPRELVSPLPVVLIKAVQADKREARDMYQCPVYLTTRR